MDLWFVYVGTTYYVVLALGAEDAEAQARRLGLDPTAVSPEENTACPA